jgi:purine catabolism regulator
VAVFGPGGGEGERDLRSRLAERLPASALGLGRTREGLVAALADEPQLAQCIESAASALGARAGVGTSGNGLASLRRSAREALRALRIGAALAGPAQVHRYDELAVLDLVRAGSPESDAFVRRTLGPLLDAGASRSPLETLRQLGAHGHRIKPAAGALGIHPHTLTYRLKQLRRRFGLDLEDPEVRLRVQLALRILDASQAPGEPRRTRRRARAR